jgi:hypothetical protein
MAAPEQVNAASCADGSGKDFARLFDLPFLCVPDGLKDLFNAGKIMFS